jgi:hypothetical protein
MNDKLAKVYSVALEVRAWAEEASEKSGNTVIDLNGWCAIASAELHNRLKRVGIDSELHMAMEHIGCHVFVVVDDYIVDVTATQFKEFRNETIVMRHNKELMDYWFYQSSEAFPSSKSLRRFQRREQWPMEQIAYA